MPRAIAHRAGRPIFCGLLSGLCIGQRPLANPGADRMQYAILCYNEEEVVWSMFKEDDPAMMTHLNSVQDRLVKSGKLGVSLRLLPPSTTTTTATATAAMTLRNAQDGETLVLDGPFAGLRRWPRDSERCMGHRHRAFASC